MSALGVRVLETDLHRVRKSINPIVNLKFMASMIGDVKRLRRIIREESVDLVQVCGLANPQGAIAARLEGVPVVWQLLGTVAPVYYRALLMPMVGFLSDVVMSTGTSVLRAHPLSSHVLRDVILFAPPVDVSVFAPSRETRRGVRESFGIESSDVVVGTVGNWNRTKAHEVLVDAVCPLLRDDKRVHLWIVGQPSPTHARYYDREVRGRVRRHGFLTSRRVRFISPEDNVATLMQAMDIFVLSSKTEGIPTAVLEAMSCGLAVVATGVGGVPEVLVDGQTGRIVESGSPSKLRATVEALIQSSHERVELGAQARQVAVHSFSAGRCADVHCEAYRRALESDGGA